MHDPLPRDPAVGGRHPRIDSRDKVLGRARYAADLAVPGQLHARVVPAVYAHARIRSIDASDALAVPGVVAVLTAADLPFALVEDEGVANPLAREEVLFAGQPVALVVAETEAAAEDAVGLVVVDSEVLPPVVDALTAIEPGAAEARLIRVEGETEEAPGEGEPAASEPGAGVSGNVCERGRAQSGDAAAAAARCDVLVEGTFGTSWVYQGYVEPQAATAWVEPDGTLVVTSATQGTFRTRDDLARLFGLPIARVRVAGTTIGGGFGGKLMVIEPLVAGAALRLKRPVRLVLDRSEDMRLNNPIQGLTIELRVGARRTGELELLAGRVVYDAGAYPGSWAWAAGGALAGPYRWGALDIETVTVRTNRFPTGSYRAPTGPQLTWAVETLLDELAGRLAMDPIALRAANVPAAGEPDTWDEPWPTTGTGACLDAVARHPLWLGRDRLPPGEGVGLALGIWSTSLLPAAATCRLEPDGTVTVITGVVDVSGATTSLVLVAAETIGVDPSVITFVTADTASAPATTASVGSSITHGAGLAVMRAAAQVRDQLLDAASTELEISRDDLEIVDGVVRPVGAPDRGRSLAWFATRDDGMGGGIARYEGHGRAVPTEGAPSAAAHLAHVRVDMETGEVAVLGYVAIQDVGRAIAPALVEGQMQGAAAQAIGIALHEGMVHDENGQLLTGSFLDYALPRATGLPPIETKVLEVPAPSGPYGARGMAETAIVPGAAAVANAIAAACGPRVRELPVTPQRLWAALQNQDRAQTPVGPSAAAVP